MVGGRRLFWNAPRRWVFLLCSSPTHFPLFSRESRSPCRRPTPQEGWGLGRMEGQWLRTWSTWSRAPLLRWSWPGIPAMPRKPTRVRPQVAGEGIPAAAGIVAEVALEGLLARVQLDVAQQVAFLGKGGPALVALERPFTWVGEKGRGWLGEKRARAAQEDRRAARKLFPMGLVTSTGCRFDRTRGF